MDITIEEIDIETTIRIKSNLQNLKNEAMRISARKQQLDERRKQRL